MIPSVIFQIGDLIPKPSPLSDPVSHPSATLESTQSALTPTLTSVALPSAPSLSTSAPTAIGISFSHPPSLTTAAITTSQPPVAASSISTPQSTSVSARPNSGVAVGITLNISSDSFPSGPTRHHISSVLPRISSWGERRHIPGDPSRTQVHTHRDAWWKNGGGAHRLRYCSRHLHIR